MLDDWCSARCPFSKLFSWSGRIQTWNSWIRCDPMLLLPVTYYSGIKVVSEAKPDETHTVGISSRCELGGISSGPQAFDGLQRQRDLVCCILI